MNESFTNAPNVFKNRVLLSSSYTSNSLLFMGTNIQLA